MAEFKVKKPTKYINGLVFKDQTGFEIYYRDEELFISGCDSQKEADDALANHNPVKPGDPTIEEKLESVGLSIADLKAALGINA